MNHGQFDDALTELDELHNEDLIMAVDKEDGVLYSVVGVEREELPDGSATVWLKIVEEA